MPTSQVDGLCVVGFISRVTRGNGDPVLIHVSSRPCAIIVSNPPVTRRHEREPHLPMRVFVNYRTNDERATALLVARHLSERVGDKNVFLDTKSIEPGALFDDVLLRNVWRSDVMVSIMGARWLDFPGRDGRAIDDPEDWIHRELVEALTHQVRIVPLLVGDATFPREHELPAPLADLARRQFVVLDLRQPDIGFARLDSVLELPAGNRDDGKRTGGQSGGIGSVHGDNNINITDPRGPLHIGDRITRPRRRT
jgi:hypothetical protein